MRVRLSAHICVRDQRTREEHFATEVLLFLNFSQTSLVQINSSGRQGFLSEVEGKQHTKQTLGHCRSGQVNLFRQLHTHHTPTQGVSLYIMVQPNTRNSEYSGCRPSLTGNEIHPTPTSGQEEAGICVKTTLLIPAWKTTALLFLQSHWASGSI